MNEDCVLPESLVKKMLMSCDLIISRMQKNVSYRVTERNGARVDVHRADVQVWRSYAERGWETNWCDIMHTLNELNTMLPE